MESDGIEAVKWAIDSDDYIAALKNEITMVASLKNQSYSEVERILDQNFSKLKKNRRISSPMQDSHWTVFLFVLHSYSFQ